LENAYWAQYDDEIEYWSHTARKKTINLTH
jgi:hypothetical protein